MAIQPAGFQFCTGDTNTNSKTKSVLFFCVFSIIHIQFEKKMNKKENEQGGKQNK